jgi:hypothetical protein
MLLFQISLYEKQLAIGCFKSVFKEKNVSPIKFC